MPFPFLPFSIHAINGHSMQPFLKEGEKVLVFRWAYLFSSPKAGDVIVFSHEGKSYVKRVASAGKSVAVAGDNSKDSRKLPPIGGKEILGKVVAHYS